MSSTNSFEMSVSPGLAEKLTRVSLSDHPDYDDQRRINQADLDVLKEFIDLKKTIRGKLRRDDLV